VDAMPLNRRTSSSSNRREKEQQTSSLQTHPTHRNTEREKEQEEEHALATHFFHRASCFASMRAEKEKMAAQQKRWKWAAKTDQETVFMNQFQ